MSSVSSPITTRPHETHFTSDFVQPPARFYLDRDDIMLILSWGSARAQEVTVKGRLLTPKGEVQRIHINHTPSTDRSPNYDFHSLTEGHLLGLTVTQTLNPIEHGDCYVEVSILRGGLFTFERTHVLISDYVSAAYSPSWPGGRLVAPSDTPTGRLYTLTGTDPPQDTEIAETVPTNARWRVRTIMFTFNTSANVGNRRVYVLFDSGDAGVVYWQKYSTVAQGEGLAKRYIICHWGTTHTDLRSDIYINMPPDVVLNEGHRIRAWAYNAQVGDNMQAPYIYLEEWFQ